MISNVITSTPAATASSGGRHSGRIANNGASAFSDALEKRGGDEAGVAAEKAEKGEQRPGGAFATPRWHTAIDAGPSGAGFAAGKAGDAGEGAAAEGAPSELAAELLAAASGAGAGSAGASDVPGRHAAGAGNAAMPAGDVPAGKGAGLQAGANADAAAGGKAGLPGAHAPTGMVLGNAGAQEALSGPDPDAGNAARIVNGAAGRQVPVAEIAAVVAGLRTGGAGAEPVQDAAKAARGRNAAAPSSQAGSDDVATGDMAKLAKALTARDGSAGDGYRIIGNARSEPRGVRGDLAKGAKPAAFEPAALTARPSGSFEVPSGNGETPAGRQVADAVLRGMEEMSATRMTLNAGTSQAGRTVKTMRLQLRPAELGAVNIRLQSVGGEMQVSIHAESDRTAQMLNNDSDTIRSALRAIGISGADVVVTSNRNEGLQNQPFGAQDRDAAGHQSGAREDHQGASNESRQSYQEARSNDSVFGQAAGDDAGRSGPGRDGRIVI
ncbi:flagellar hook-length control protein FliK [Oricola thermophila]|uniref:Flagellar hook-length control protein FliK n=1 Tax=Oricola thermophila TaxID=2742145 RepID=A0A6N1VK99_9HYPH|nr:flagellar hook-length control protein FliK [Oricola thermophila]QKV19629.1 flagellar hook-length control protein FliK [Oricola thermophila]